MTEASVSFAGNLTDNPEPGWPSRSRRRIAATARAQDWRLAAASDVATGRQSWKDDPGRGDVATKHDAGDDRNVEVVMAKCCRWLEEGTHG
jgi:hypothetical protein